MTPSALPISDAPLTAHFNIAELVMTFPGPAMLVSAQADVLQTNTLATPLLSALCNDSGAALRAMIQQVADTGISLTRRQDVSETSGNVLLFNLVLLPVETANNGRSVVLLAQDSTTNLSLHRALIASRELFKDLVDCSSDFAWETDANGAFSFVSTKGALGFSAKELNGTQANDLLVAAGDRQSSPFEARDPQDDAEIWLYTAGGGVACVRVSALGVYSDDGDWRGARGVCRDITEARERDQALTRARKREQLTRTLIDSIRTGLDPQDMLTNAVAAIGGALHASHTMVYRLSDAGEETLAAAHLMSGESPLAVPPIDWTAAGSQIVIDHGRRERHRLLSASCRYQDTTKGRLCIAWPYPTDLPDDVRDIISDVTGQIGIVIAQAEIQEKLSHLSNTDELTGLPNRRSFHEQVGRSIANHRRNKRVGTLLYIDLDNFKAVNDTHGHQQGDAALRTIANLLTDSSFRASDIPGRLGGDEFAYWLEETDIAGAMHLAKELHRRARILKDFSGSPQKPLSLSIGIAAMDPLVSEDLDALIARADKAMYAVKRTEKGEIAVADPPEPCKPE